MISNKHIAIRALFVLFVFHFTTVNAQIFTDSNLPIVVINTDLNPNTGLPFPIEDDPRVLATMKIIKRPDGSRNFLTDISNATFLNYSGRINIEIRGSTSQDLPKKPYGLTTLLADNISNNNVSILGMPAENDWILNSFAYDASYMRDYLSYNLSTQIGNYASRTNYCEVVINGDYKGLYLLQEKLKADSNRINVLKISTTDVTGDAITGGYITKADKTTGGDPIAWQMNPNVGIPVIYIHELPKPIDVVPSQNTYISSVFFSLDNNVSSTSLQTGFPSIIDVPSFIDFMLLNEFTSNVDAYQYSTYFHKDRSGKLRAGPVWDLNLSFGNDLFQFGFDRSKTNIWQFSNGDNEGSKFWNNLFNNSTFKCYMSKRWNEIKQTDQPLNQTSLNNFIDTTVATINEGANRDAQRWFGSGGNLTNQTIVIKNFITARLLWMTTNLGSFSNCNSVVTPSLVISKIHYNPIIEGAFTSNNQEFIEISNTGTSTVNLSGIYLKELGVSYQFPFNSLINASQKVYLASNLATFQSKYGFAANGQFTRNLSNKSQKLVLSDAFGNIIDSVTYTDTAPWPVSADGTGPHLQLIDNALDNNLGVNWTTSTTLSQNDFDATTNALVYPNPTQSILNIETSNMIDLIQVFDSEGRVLISYKPQGISTQLDCKLFASGFYFIQLSKGINTSIMKFIKN